MKAEALLRSRRPEDLPVPHDGDLEVDGEAALEDSAVGSVTGKGRGAMSLGSQGGRLFVTPPSNHREGRGVGGGGKKSEGVMPSSGGSSVEATKLSMGRLAPKSQGPVSDRPDDPGIRNGDIPERTECSVDERSRVVEERSAAWSW